MDKKSISVRHVRTKILEYIIVYGGLFMKCVITDILFSDKLNYVMWSLYHIYLGCRKNNNYNNNSNTCV